MSRGPGRPGPTAHRRDQRVRRGKTVRTTRPDERGGFGHRIWSTNFTAAAPNQLWVTDLTYVPTCPGVASASMTPTCSDRRLATCRTRRLDGPRRDRDGPLVTRHEPRRVAMPLRCRSSRRSAARRTTRRDRRRPLRIGRRQLRQRAPWRPSTATTRPSSSVGPDTALAQRRRRRARHPRIGTLAQHRTPPRLPRRRDMAPTEFEQAFYAALNKPPRQGWESDSPSLQQTQGDSRSPLLMLLALASTAYTQNRAGMMMSVAG